MGQEEDRARAKRDRIERLRRRLELIAIHHSQPEVRQLRDIIKGLLDLLEDEL